MGFKMSVFQIIMLIIGLLMALFSFYIGYIFFFCSNEKKLSVASNTKSSISEICKLILNIIKIVIACMIISYIVKILIKIVTKY